MMLDLDSEKIMVIGMFVLNLQQCIIINSLFFDKKQKNVWVDVVLFLLYSILVLFSIISPNSIWNALFVLIALFFTLDVLRKEKIIYVLKVFFLSVCFGYIVQLILSVITKINLYSMSNGIWLLGYILTLGILVFLVMFKRFFNLRKETNRQRIMKYLTYASMLIMGISIPMTISGLGFAASYVNSPKFNLITNVLSVFAFSSLIFLVLFIFYINDTNKKMKKYLDMEKLLMESQKNYYEKMLKKEDETRKFRHDLTSQIMCLRGFAEHGANEMVLAGLLKIQHQMQMIQNGQNNFFSVENEVIDIILNGLIPQIKDADVMVEGSCTAKVNIDDMELCTVISNLLQNAIEELNDMDNDDKKIKIQVFQGKQYMRLKISNSSRKKEMDSNSKLPQTTKLDKKNHGIGLRSVRETVERNGGYFIWKCKENEFCVEVNFPLEEW